MIPARHRFRTTATTAQTKLISYAKNRGDQKVNAQHACQRAKHTNKHKCTT